MSEDQARYQIRFGWGSTGAAVLGAAVDVAVWVDVLEAAPPDLEWFATADVVTADVRTARAAAAWVAGMQREAGRRLAVAVIAAGRPEAGGVGYAVEDHLGAGAVIARLGDLGLDATSPEAAVAEAAFRSLEGAVGHLVSASAAGRRLGVTPSAFRVDDGLDASAVTILRVRPRPPA